MVWFLPTHIKAQLRKREGMSLVEATIILMVLAVLTAVLAPAVNQYVDDAREAKAKEDVEAIGTAVARLLRDAGMPCLVYAGNTTCEKSSRADLLVGDGNKPIAGANINTAVTNTSNMHAAVGWSSDLAAPSLNANVASMYGTFVQNRPFEQGNNELYVHPGQTTNLVPSTSIDPAVPNSLGAFGHGWRGAYLSGIVEPDPWGYRYMVNSVYLGAARDATTSGEGRAGTGWSFDTFVVSAGRNNTVETDFESTNLKGTSLATGGSVGNDDLLYVISGFGK